MQQQVRRSTHEFTALEKGKQPVVSTKEKPPKSAEKHSNSGQVELGSPPDAVAGRPDAAVEVFDSTAGKVVAEPSSHDDCIPAPGSKMQSSNGCFMRSGGVVELGSRRAASTMNSCSRGSGVRTNSPSPDRERHGSIIRAQIPERLHSMRHSVQTGPDSRSKHVDRWQVKATKLPEGKRVSPEVSGNVKHMRILRREVHGDLRADRGSLKLGLNHTGPEFVDPIILGESEVTVGLGDTVLKAACDPVLLCEVGCDLGPSHSNQGSVHIGPGLLMLYDPLVVLAKHFETNKEAGEHGIHDNVMEVGQGLGDGLLVLAQQVEVNREKDSREILVGKTESAFGLIDGPLNKGVDIEHGPNLSLGTKCSGELDLGSFNFSDKSVLPNFTPPAGFIWEFIAGGWSLRPSVSQSNTAEGE